MKKKSLITLAAVMGGVIVVLIAQVSDKDFDSSDWTAKAGAVGEQLRSETLDRYGNPGGQPRQEDLDVMRKDAEMRVQQEVLKEYYDQKAAQGR